MIRSHWFIALAAVLALGCAGAPRDPFAVAAGAPRWPAPPDPPRVVWVASIAEHGDLFEERGFWTSVARAVGGPRDSRMRRPFAVAVHPDGGLLVTDPGAGLVHFYDIPRRRYVAIGGDVEGGLPSPVGVAAMGDGSILVADSRRGAIERFSARGKHMGRFAPDVALGRPAGIAVDRATGDVFVVDVLANAILSFDAKGDLRGSIGARGSGPGEFNFPTHLALDERGDLLVADSMNFRVQRVARDGTAISSFGRAGDARGDFARPKGVAAVGPDAFAAVEGLYDSVVFFDGAGNLLMTLGGAGSGPGEFWLPSGLAFDPGRRLLFVADGYNGRVQAFRIEDAPPGEKP